MRRERVGGTTMGGTPPALTPAGIRCCWCGNIYAYSLGEFLGAGRGGYKEWGGGSNRQPDPARRRRRRTKGKKGGYECAAQKVRPLHIYHAHLSPRLAGGRAEEGAHCSKQYPGPLGEHVGPNGSNTAMWGRLWLRGAHTCVSCGGENGGVRGRCGSRAGGTGRVGVPRVVKPNFVQCTQRDGITITSVCASGAGGDRVLPPIGDEYHQHYTLYATLAPGTRGVGAGGRERSV